jgi:hypothetical protein
MPTQVSLRGLAGSDVMKRNCCVLVRPLVDVDILSSVSASGALTVRQSLGTPRT